MANVDRYINKKKRSEEGNRVEFERKILRDGSNKFRIRGEIKFVFEHWFKSKDGISVHSICGKHYDEDGEITGGCRICEEYDQARALLADEDGQHSAEDIERAEVIVGDRQAEGDQYPSAWKAREFAYMNVIDRDDRWCEENKKTKILSKSKSQAGISSGRGGIFDSVVEMFEEYGDYEKYDIKMKKSGKKMDTKYTCFKDSESELTKDEAKYEAISLEDVSKPTADSLLKTWLEVGVKKKKDGEAADKPKGKTLFAKGVTKPKPKAEEEPEQEEEQEEEQQEEEEQTPPPKKAAAPAKKKPEPEPEEEQQEEEQEEEAPKAPSKFKVAAKKQEPPKKKKEEEEELAECPECGANIPITSEKCPECGAVFEGLEEEESDV